MNYSPCLTQRGYLSGKGNSGNELDEDNKSIESKFADDIKQCNIVGCEHNSEMSNGL